MSDIIERLDEILSGAEHGVPVLTTAKLLTIIDAQIEIKDLRYRLARAEEVVRFYANRGHWITPSTGFSAIYDPVPSEVRDDRGQRARAYIQKHGEED